MTFDEYVMMLILELLRDNDGVMPYSALAESVDFPIDYTIDAFNNLLRESFIYRDWSYQDEAHYGATGYGNTWFKHMLEVT